MRYPSRDGIIVSPYELGLTVPTPEHRKLRNNVNVHHGWYERRMYQDTQFRSVFRNLIVHTFPLLIIEHHELHGDFDPPKRPEDSRMIEILDDYMAVNGVITVIRESCTRDTQDISIDRWHSIKDSYKRSNNGKV
jgi:hypothetical protein